MKPVTIIFEDEEILLVKKEAGVSVQGGAGISHPLDEELSKQCGYKVHLVHRLDRETSGILVVAKNPAAAAKWTRLIQTKEVKKEYTVICFGIPQINGKKQMKGTLRGIVEAHGRKQDAVLDYNVVSSVAVSVEKEGKEHVLELSKIRVVLGTGRMHQIRIQMAGAGCPVAGDDKHGNFSLNKLARKAGIKRLCLCASRLTVPLGGKPVEFETELPDFFSIVEG